MLLISCLIFCPAGLGTLAIGARHITARPLIYAYHREMLAGDMTSETPVIVVQAGDKALRGAFFTLGLGVTALIAVTRVWNDQFTSKVILLILTIIAGWFAVMRAQDVTKRMSVTMPWRINAGVSGMAMLGLALSFW